MTQIDRIDQCPTCGAAVAIVTGDEGTSFMVPIAKVAEQGSALITPEVEAAILALLRIERLPPPSDD